MNAKLIRDVIFTIHSNFKLLIRLVPLFRRKVGVLLLVAKDAAEHKSQHASSGNDATDHSRSRNRQQGYFSGHFLISCKRRRRRHRIIGHV